MSSTACGYVDGDIAPDLLTDAQWRVLMILADGHTLDGCFDRPATVAKRTGKTEKQVETVMRALERKGFIARLRAISPYSGLMVDQVVFEFEFDEFNIPRKRPAPPPMQMRHPRPDPDAGAS